LREFKQIDFEGVVSQANKFNYGGLSYLYTVSGAKLSIITIAGGFNNSRHGYNSMNGTLMV
jgi:hypothetical protein